MSKSAFVKSIISEYGIPWAFNRVLYSCKLKALSALPWSEQLFEVKKNTIVQRLNVFSIDIKAIADFLKTLPDEAKIDLINAADNACEGKIQGFSSILLDYGNPINWQLNPLTGKSCDAKEKWFMIPDFDPERGDIKAIWEISRFTHFYSFSRAYLLTGDEKYYEAFSRQLNQWLIENPYSYGANFKCGQECALRLINGLMAYTVFMKGGLTRAVDEENIQALINRCYRKILSNFFYAYRCIKNNHTISEVAGMIIGAWCCGDERQVRKAYGLLDRVICEQFTEDGGYTQFSFNYQRLALQDIECVMSLNTGFRLSKDAVERVKQSALLMYQCQSENGDVPNYGSNDGALIFPVASYDYRDYRPTINCIHVMTAGSRLYTGSPCDEELLWFAGGIEKYSVNQLHRRSEQYPDAGLYTLRNSSSIAMIVSNDFKTRPAHMDQLHLDLWIDGINVLCDSGTYSYASELGTVLAGTYGHNTVKVAKVEQMTRFGAFMLCGWTKREGVEWSDGSFKGTMKSNNGYKHRRKVVSADDGLIITDEVGVAELKCAAFDVLFHTPCSVDRTDEGVILNYEGKGLCKLVTNASNITIEDAEQSLYYLQSNTIKLIRIHGNSATKIVTKIQINRWNEA